LVRLLAWLTLLPTARIFPQISHALATVVLLLISQTEAHATTTGLSLTSAPARLVCRNLCRAW